MTSTIRVTDKEKEKIEEQRFNDALYLQDLLFQLNIQGVATEKNGQRMLPNDVAAQMNRPNPPRKYVYTDCLAYLTKLGYEFYPFQKQMLQLMCEDKEFAAARGMGRSYVSKAFARYVAYCWDKRDMRIPPAKAFTALEAIKCGTMDPGFLETMEEMLSEEAFERDFFPTVE